MVFLKKIFFNQHRDDVMHSKSDNNVFWRKKVLILLGIQ